MGGKKLRKVKLALLILFSLSTVISTDLLLNYLSAIQIVDGSIGCTSLLHKMFGIFSDHGWSLQKFLNAATYAVWANVAIGLIYLWISQYDVYLCKVSKIL